MVNNNLKILYFIILHNNICLLFSMLKVLLHYYFGLWLPYLNIKYI